MRLVYFVLILLVSVVVSIGQDRTYDLAEKAYNDKDFDSAILVYEQDVLKGIHSAGLYFNLGNIYKEKGEIARCILNYEKAVLLSPGNKDILHNLRLANDLIENPISDVNNFFLSKLYIGSVNSLKSGSLLFIFMLFVFLFLALVFFLLFRDISFIEKYKWLIGVVLAILIISVYTVLQRRVSLESGNHSIIMEKTNIYSGADLRSQILHEVDGGIKAVVLDSIGDWYKLNLPDREQGWILKKNIELIK